MTLGSDKDIPLMGDTYINTVEDKPVAKVDTTDNGAEGLDENPAPMPPTDGPGDAGAEKTPGFSLAAALIGLMAMFLARRSGH